MSVCHSLNSLTTTAIKKVSKWHPLKPCMDGNVAPLNWSEAGERNFFGPDMAGEAEDQIRLIQANLKAAQSRQKSYA